MAAMTATAIALSPNLSFAAEGRATVEVLADAFADALAQEVEDRFTGKTLLFSIRPAEGCAEARGGLQDLASLLQGLLPEHLARAGFTSALPCLPGPDCVRLALNGRTAAHLQLQLHAGNEELLLSGLLRPTWLGFWTGRIEGGHPRLLEASASMDYRTRIMLGAERTAGSGGALRIEELLRLKGSAIALTAGDLTGDGEDEVLVLLQTALLVFAHEPLEGLREIARHDLSLRPRAVVPARDPAGGVAVTTIGGTPAIVYNHTSLAEGEVLAFEQGRPMRRLAGVTEYPIAGRGGTVVYASSLQGTNLFRGPLRIAGPAGAARIEIERPLFAAAVNDHGAFLMAVDSNHGLTDLSSDGAPLARPVGSTLALARLDSTGELLLVGSSGAPSAEEDWLVVSDLEGRVKELRPVSGTIRAVASGNVTGAALDEVFVLTEHGDQCSILLLTSNARSRAATTEKEGFR